MKVFCKINNINDVSSLYDLKRFKKYIHLPDGQLNLIKNSEYFVYGIVFRDNAPWYYLCEDEFDDSPTAYPSELFNIVDDRFSQYWRLSTVNYSDRVLSSLVFKEWAEDPSYFERLVDGDFSAVSLFEKYKELMELE